MKLYVLLSCIISVTLGEMEDGVSYLVKPGVKDCFYREMEIGDRMDFESQVLSGGDVDISISIYSPSGQIIMNEQRQTEVSRDIEIDEKGAYEICFDNSFSLYSSKVVYFDLGIDHYNLTGLDHLELMKDLKLEKDGYENVKEIVESLDKIGLKFETIQQMQSLFRSRYTRHAYLQDSNLYLVTWFSTVSCVLMVAVGLLQVYLIRSFFNEKTSRGMQNRL